MFFILTNAFFLLFSSKYLSNKRNDIEFSIPNVIFFLIKIILSYLIYFEKTEFLKFFIRDWTIKINE